MQKKSVFAIKNFENIKQLYDNAKYYMSTGELEGALVSYSSCVSIINTIQEILKAEEINAVDGDGVRARKVEAVVAAPREEGAAAAAPAQVYADEIEEQGSECLVLNSEIDSELGDCEKSLENTSLKCLTQIGYLQQKLQERNASRVQMENDDGDKKVDYKKICKDIHPIVFKKGSANCLFFDDLAGLKKEKELIIESLIKPLIYPNLFPEIGKGFLLYGPPGTGKTLLAKAAVNQLQVLDDTISVLFFAPTGADLKGKYVGETEKNITKYFTCASRAACEHEEECGKRTISILFIDEIDSIARSRSGDTTGIGSNSVNTLLQMMDGVLSFDNVAVIGATNYPWELDAAVLRRFDTQILLDVPNQEGAEKAVMLEFNKFISLSEKVLESCTRHGIVKSSNIEEDIEKKNVCGIECDYQTKKIDKYALAPYNEFDYSFIKSRKSFRLMAIVQEMISNKFSYSDISKVMKRAATLTALSSLETGIFYKLQGILSDVTDIPNTYISSLNLPSSSRKDVLHTTYYTALQNLMRGKDDNSEDVGAPELSFDRYARRALPLLTAKRNLGEQQTQLTKFYNKFYIETPPSTFSVSFGYHIYWNTKILLDIDPNLTIKDSSCKERYVLINLDIARRFYNDAGPKQNELMNMLGSFWDVLEQRTWTIHDSDSDKSYTISQLYEKSKEPDPLSPTTKVRDSETGEEVGLSELMSEAPKKQEAKKELVISILSTINAMNFTPAKKKYLIKLWIKDWESRVSFGEDVGKVTEEDKEYIDKMGSRDPSRQYMAYRFSGYGERTMSWAPHYRSVKMITNYNQPLKWIGTEFSGDNFLTNSYQIIKDKTKNYLDERFIFIRRFKSDLVELLNSLSVFPDSLDIGGDDKIQYEAMKEAGTWNKETLFSFEEDMLNKVLDYAFELEALASNDWTADVTSEHIERLIVIKKLIWDTKTPVQHLELCKICNYTSVDKLLLNKKVDTLDTLDDYYKLLLADLFDCGLSPEEIITNILLPNPEGQSDEDNNITRRLIILSQNFYFGNLEKYSKDEARELVIKKAATIKNGTFELNEIYIKSYNLIGHLFLYVSSSDSTSVTSNRAKIIILLMYFLIYINEFTRHSAPAAAAAAVAGVKQFETLKERAFILTTILKLFCEFSDNLVVLYSSESVKRILKIITGEEIEFSTTDAQIEFPPTLRKTANNLIKMKDHSDLYNGGFVIKPVMMTTIKGVTTDLIPMINISQTTDATRGLIDLGHIYNNIFLNQDHKLGEYPNNYDAFMLSTIDPHNSNFGHVYQDDGLSNWFGKIVTQLKSITSGISKVELKGLLYDLVKKKVTFMQHAAKNSNYMGIRLQTGGVIKWYNNQYPSGGDTGLFWTANLIDSLVEVIQYLINTIKKNPPGTKPLSATVIFSRALAYLVPTYTVSKTGKTALILALAGISSITGGIGLVVVAIIAVIVISNTQLRGILSMGAGGLLQFIKNIIPGTRIGVLGVGVLGAVNTSVLILLWAMSVGLPLIINSLRNLFNAPQNDGLILSSARNNLSKHFSSNGITVMELKKEETDGRGERGVSTEKDIRITHASGEDNHPTIFKGVQSLYHKTNIELRTNYNNCYFTQIITQLLIYQVSAGVTTALDSELPDVVVKTIIPDRLYGVRHGIESLTKDEEVLTLLQSAYDAMDPTDCGSSQLAELLLADGALNFANQVWGAEAEEGGAAESLVAGEGGAAAAEGGAAAEEGGATKTEIIIKRAMKYRCAEGLSSVKINKLIDQLKSLISKYKASYDEQKGTMESLREFAQLRKVDEPVLDWTPTDASSAAAPAVVAEKPVTTKFVQTTTDKGSKPDSELSQEIIDLSNDAAFKDLVYRAIQNTEREDVLMAKILKQIINSNNPLAYRFKDDGTTSKVYGTNLSVLEDKSIFDIDSKYIPDAIKIISNIKKNLKVIDILPACIQTAMVGNKGSYDLELGKDLRDYTNDKDKFMERLRKKKNQ